jgi:hypothetical protein
VRPIGSGAIHPADLAFMVLAGTPVEELAARVGVKPESLIRQAERYNVPLPESWRAVRYERVKKWKREHRRKCGRREAKAA